MYVEDKQEYDILFQGKYLTIDWGMKFTQDDLKRDDFDENNDLEQEYSPFQDKANKYERYGFTFNSVNDEHSVIFEKIQKSEQKEILAIYSCYEILKDLSIRLQDAKLDVISDDYVDKSRKCFINLIKFVLQINSKKDYFNPDQPNRIR